MISTLFTTLDPARAGFFVVRRRIRISPIGLIIFVRRYFTDDRDLRIILR